MMPVCVHYAFSVSSAGDGCGDIKLLGFHPDLDLGPIASTVEEYSLLLQVCMTEMTEMRAPLT